MTDLWLISVPLDKTSLSNVEQLKHSIATNNWASCNKFTIPDLKVGVLDSLLTMSDDLSKLDKLTESVVKKTGQCIKEVMEHSADKVLENVLANGDRDMTGHQRDVLSPLNTYLNSFRANLMSYVTKFQWDKAKYPTALSISSLADIINKDISQLERELKCQSAAYNDVKSSLQSLEYELEWNLQTRSLNGIVRKEDLVSSEYLTTLLVVVSRGNYLKWERTYESLSDFVVPRSSRKLHEDRESGIFSVTLFRRAVSEFKAKAQHSKFTVREYSFDQEEEKQHKRKQLSVHKKEQYRIFVRWLKVNYSEMFIAWIHLKALRVFVESVLRYGLPVSYQAFLLQADSKHSKKLKEDLASLFMHLDPTATTGRTDQPSGDIAAGLCQQEYFSYVCFEINTNMLHMS